MSAHSPGPVVDEEILARFVFDPMHVRKNGKVKSSIFSHAAQKGCSVQRESRADDAEIATFVQSFLKAQSAQSWCGVLLGKAGNVRAMTIAGSAARAACVYDTAEPANPAHAEIGKGSDVNGEGDENELRRLLMLTFNDGQTIALDEYRKGVVSVAVEQEADGKLDGP